jgi:hypothetical protein
MFMAERQSWGAPTRRPLIALMGAMLIAFVGLGASVIVPSASASEEAVALSAPVAFRVKLPDVSTMNASGDAGKIASSDVTVYAWPSQEFDRGLEPGDEFKLHKVAATIALESNEIAVHVDPSKLPPRYVTSDGLVDFDVQVRNRAEGWAKSTAVTARAARADGVSSVASPAVWTDAADDPATLEPGTADVASVDLIAPEAVTDECADTMATTENCQPESSAAPTSYDWDQCIVLGNDVSLVESKNAWTRVGATFALKTDPHDSKAQMIYSSSQEHQTTGGIAASLNGTSWSSVGTKTVSDQWAKAFLQNQDYRSYRIELRYGKYKVTKIDQCLGYAVGYGYKWRPRYETGGTQTVSISRPSVYTRCSDQAPGPWERTSSDASAYEHSGGVLFSGTVGFDLQSKSQYATYKKYVYDIRGGDKMICGNNDYPSRSRLQMLRYR